MNTAMVWVLMTIAGYGGGEVVYSPPVADLASCQRMQQVFAKEYGAYDNNRCVEIKIYK